MTERDQADIIETAHALADAARAAILPYFRAANLAAENKDGSGFDPVTEADRAAEQAMRAVLAQRRPSDGIHGEEYGITAGESGLTWVLDPIDGTRAFICGTPSWGVLIALSGPDKVHFGMIDQPYIGERFVGGFGQAEYSGPHGVQPLGVSRTTELSGARLMTTFPELGTNAERAAFSRVAAEVRLTRYGLDCYAYALLAAGQVDLVIEAGLNAYDIQGPIGVIEAAGGIVTDWQGGPALQGGTALAAATPDLHRAAMALLNGKAP